MSTGLQAIRVLVVDSKQLWAGLLVERLRQVPGIEASAFTSIDSLLSVVTAATPDLVLIGMEEPDSCPALFAMMESIHAIQPAMRIVVLVNSVDGVVIREAFFAGASGVISPNEPFEVLIECVRRVHAGQIWLRHDQFGGFLDLMDLSGTNPAVVNACNAEALTDRQLKLVQCVAKGMTNREIALQLDLSEHTVRNYLFRIFRKIGVSNRAELVGTTMHHPQAPFRSVGAPIPIN